MCFSWIGRGYYIIYELYHFFYIEILVVISVMIITILINLFITSST